MLSPIFSLIATMEDFTKYDIKPEGFINYLRYYGEHFNKKLCEFACSHLNKHTYTKEKIDELLKNHSAAIPNAKLYDAVYVANWCDSILYNSSISDEKHFIFFLQDMFEKQGHLIFNRWYADMAKLGIPIEWEDMI